jgi:hypothetical protein
MALNAAIHWGLILRVDVPHAITQDGWKYLLSQARYPFNFDGEIFGLHSTMAEQLRESCSNTSRCFTTQSARTRTTECCHPLTSKTGSRN